MAYERDLEFIYSNPTKITYRENGVQDVGVEVDELRCSKAFLVTDTGVVEAGLVEGVQKALGKKLVGTYDKCCQDSGYHVVDEAAGMAREKGADCLVSIGGGSVIDTAKAMTPVVKSGGKLADYEGLQVLTEPQTPHIAIPTTAGTGAEVTNVVVIKDWDRNLKQFFISPFFTANVAILDPTLTAGLPPMLTATTGMDALTHAIEGMVDTPAEPIVDALCLHAIRLIMNNLPICVENGDDLLARGHQMLAATIAGIGFSNSQAGLVHTIAHTLGGLYGVPHGLGNSIMLPHVMRFNLEDAADKYAMIAEAMGIDVRGMSEMEAGAAAADAVAELTKRMGVPQKLSEAEVPQEELEKVADQALSDGTIVFNPRMVMDSSEVMELLKKAY
jgi:aldehyde dehydrogenase (NAD+)